MKEDQLHWRQDRSPHPAKLRRSEAGAPPSFLFASAKPEPIRSALADDLAGSWFNELSVEFFNASSAMSMMLILEQAQLALSRLLPPGPQPKLFSDSGAVGSAFIFTTSQSTVASSSILSGDFEPVDECCRCFNGGEVFPALSLNKQCDLHPVLPHQNGLVQMDRRLPIACRNADSCHLNHSTCA